ncbi:MAG: PadR family transcriptional regulator [Chloroflexota bacterium]|jgi:PadR family transcriptional regulator PadR
MNVQFKKGVLELCVLALVAQRDRYGYELVERISQQIEIAEGTVYPLLRRLTQDGYFETYLQESVEGPPRKYYRITQLGQRTLKELRREWQLFADGVNALLIEGGSHD